MDVVLLLSTLLLFVWALVGGIASRCLAGVSKRWTDLANSVAGGVVVSVALVHMLGEAAEELEDWSHAVGAWITGDAEAALPVGEMLCFGGFFLLLLVEQLGGGHMHEVHKEPDAESPDVESPEQEPSGARRETVEVVQKSDGVAAVGVVSGVFLHSFLEGVAAGVSASPVAFGAIAIHKFFSAFAVGSALLPVAAPAWWWIGNVLFALSGTVGIFLGQGIAEALEGPATAAVICFAAGSLLCVGITDMLLPGLAGGGLWGRRKVLASFLAASVVAFIGVWA